MRKMIYSFLAMAYVVTIFAGCSVNDVSKLEGVSHEVYVRGIEFIDYLDNTPMVGQQEGEQRLNAIAPDDAPDSEALFEDVIYILWVYHNIKCIDTAAEEINKMWKDIGVNSTVQQEYSACRDRILDATTQEELWSIWNAASKAEGKGA